MSVLLEFAMFPTDKGISVSEFVSKIVKMIDESGLEYQLTPMGTIVETVDLNDALNIINKSYKVLEPYSERVYCSCKFDIKKNGEDMLHAKIASVESKIGTVKK